MTGRGPNSTGPNLPRRSGSGQASGPGEFHPEALSETDVNVSAHPAPIIQPGTTGFVSTIGSSPFRLTHAQDRMTQPLRSTDITPLQRYYELLRPGAAHRYSGSRGVTHLSFSLSIATTGSHVPQQSLKQRHATFTPDTIQPISRLPLDSSQATE